MNKKYKILTLSDSPLFPSGVGTQTMYLIRGLLKTGKYSFRCFGGARQHADYRPVIVDKENHGEDFIVFPVDGFGDENKLRQVIDQEKPDAILLVTDPRFFEWVWRIEDEIRPRLPITYWHLWDNYPVPKFNKVFYDSCDFIGSINEQTMVFLDKCGTETPHVYIPHSIPNDIMFPVDETINQINRKKIFGPNSDKCIFMYVGRNAMRKRVSSLMQAFSMVLSKHPDIFLYMHSSPHDIEGPNLIDVAGIMGLEGNKHIGFMSQPINIVGMRDLYNAVDIFTSVSSAEGFGCPLQEALCCGTRSTVARTGGMADQIIHEDLGSYIEIDARNLNGTQNIPYIYDDYCSIEGIAESLEQNYLLWKKLGRAELRNRTIAQIPLLKQKFNYDDMISRWDKGLEETINKHKEKIANKKLFITEI